MRLRAAIALFAAIVYGALLSVASHEFGWSDTHTLIVALIGAVIGGAFGPIYIYLGSWPR